MRLKNYLLFTKDGYLIRFQYTWFSLFLSWLEYSVFSIKRCCILLIVQSF